MTVCVTLLALAAQFENRLAKSLQRMTKHTYVESYTTHVSGCAPLEPLLDNCIA